MDERPTPVADGMHIAVAILLALAAVIIALIAAFR